MWFIYIVQCSDASFYTGITNNIKRRLHQHNASPTIGAKYTRTRRPVKLVYEEKSETRSSATKREREIKKFSRIAKEQLIANHVTLPRS